MQASLLLEAPSLIAAQRRAVHCRGRHSPKVGTLINQLAACAHAARL